MKNNTIKKGIVLLAVMFCLGLWLQGEVKVITSYRYIADIVRQVGGEAVSVTALARGDRDPHFITPKPSFIAKLRRADLLVVNGGQLEIGWLPAVLRQANNGHVKPGGKGFLELMSRVKPIDVPLDVSRAHGDVHPEGNPHIQLDPHHIPGFALAIMDALCAAAPGKCETFRTNHDAFIKKWRAKMTEWEGKLHALKGRKVVESHRLYAYLFHRYGVESAAALEPLPGIPATSRHLIKVMKLIKKENIGIIVQDVYHSAKTARFAAEKTGARVVIVPHDVGAVKEATDIFALFDEIVRRLTSS